MINAHLLVGAAGFDVRLAHSSAVRRATLVSVIRDELRAEWSGP